MHHAIERREFVLHYQPVVDLPSGAVTAVEALIRWQPPDGALVPRTGSSRWPSAPG